MSLDDVQEIISLVKNLGMVEIESNGLLASIDTMNLVIKSMRQLAEDGIEVHLMPSEIKIDANLLEVRWLLKKILK